MDVENSMYTDGGTRMTVNQVKAEKTRLAVERDKKLEQERRDLEVRKQL